MDNSVYSTQDANKIDVDLQKPSRFDEFYIFLGFTIFNISFNLSECSRAHMIHDVHVYAHYSKRAMLLESNPC